ncbi:MAG: tetratricopeptide repeat protein [Syntrophales bacterium]|jgi:tetratricopeptide (TPR) repeat protein|nr:tetratricopeptide repeat protein [Syntrophales bacterium]
MDSDTSRESHRPGLLVRFRRALRKKDMWKQMALELGLVLFVMVVLFFDSIVKWVNRPSVPKSTIIEKVAPQITVKIADQERKQIFSRVRGLLEQGKSEEAIKDLQQYQIRDSSNAEAFYLMGMALLRQGKVTNAFEQMQAALRLRPEYPEVNQVLGELYLLYGDVKEAKNRVVPLLNSPDHLSDGYLMEAQIAAAEGKYDMAFAKVQEAVKKSKGTPTINVSAYMASLYVQKGEIAKAKEIMSKFACASLDGEGLVKKVKFDFLVREEKEAVSCLKGGLTRYPQNADLNYLYGQYFFSAGKFMDAAAYYKKAAEIMPGFTIFFYRAGQSLLAARALKEAELLIEGMLSRNPDDLLGLRLKVQAQIQAGDRKEAINTLKKIATKALKDPRPQLLLAELYLAEGVVALAEKHALRAIALGEKTTPPWTMLGDIYYRRGDFPKALAYYEKVLAVEPGNIMLMLQMGDAFLNTGKVDKAEGLYRKAAAANPKAGFIQNKLAWARLVAGDREGANRLSRKYFESSPRDINSLGGYVNVLVAGQRFDDALALLKGYPQEKGNISLIKLMMGDIYALKKDSATAGESYRQALKARPDDVNFMINIAARYEKINLDKDAEDIYSQLQRRFPRNMLFANHLAWFYIEVKKEPERAAKLVALLESEGTGTGAKDTVGWYYYKTGDLKKAEYYLREAVAIDPENAVVRGHLAMTLFGKKEEAEAVSEAKKAIGALSGTSLKGELERMLSKERGK